MKALRWAAVAALCALVGTGCGSRRSNADVKAAWGYEPVSSSAVGGAAGAGAAAEPDDTLSGGGESGVLGAAAPAARAANGADDAASGIDRKPSTSAGSSNSGKPAASAATARVAAGERPADPAVPRQVTPGPGRPVPAPDGASGGPATGKPIILGSVGTYSGIVGNSLKGGLVAAQAWVQATNTAGGIGGHPVELVVADDGADPARHQQLVQQLVEQRNVKAFVYNAEAVTGQASVRYLTERRVPVVGSEGAGEWFYQSPMYFPQAPHGTTLQRAALAGAADLLVPQGKTKLGMIACTEAQFCNDAAKIWPELARKVGFQLVYQARASIAQPSFTAECLGAKNAGVQFLFIVEDANTFGRVARDCRGVGYGPVFGLVSANTQDRHKDDPNLDGAVVPVPMVPWFATDNPEIVHYQQVLRRYAPGAVPDGSTENGWVAARLFEAAARRSPDPTTSAGILEGLWALRGETVGGVTGALTFPKEATAPRVTCWAHVVATKGKWESPSGGNLACRNDL